MKGTRRWSKHIYQSHLSQIGLIDCFVPFRMRSIPRHMEIYLALLYAAPCFLPCTMDLRDMVCSVFHGHRMCTPGEELGIGRSWTTNDTLTFASSWSWACFAGTYDSVSVALCFACCHVVWLSYSGSARITPCKRGVVRNDVVSHIPFASVVWHA